MRGAGAGSEVWPCYGKSVTGIEFPIHVFVQLFYIAETCANVQLYRLALAINHLHRRHPMIKNLASTFLACFALAACGGGEGNPGQCLGSAAVCSPAAGSSTAANVSTVLPGPVGEAKFAASSTYAQQCVAPRPAGSVDPYTQQVYNDKAGSVSTELQWIRSFVNGVGWTV